MTHTHTNPTAIAKHAAASLFILACALAGGCATEPSAGPLPTRDEVATELADLIQFERDNQPAPVPEPTGLPEPIRIPRGAIWIGEPAGVSFSTTPRDAVSLATPPGTPIRWNLDPTRPTPGAITHLERETTAADILDKIAMAADWHWEWDGAAIFITDTITRTYPIPTLPGTQEITMPSRSMQVDQNEGGGQGGGQGGGGGGGGQGGGGGDGDGEIAKNEFTATLDVYDALTTLANHSVSNVPNGGTYSILPEANLLLVTGPPSAHERAKALLAEFSAQINKRVLVTFTVFELTARDSNSRGFDFQLLRDAAVAANVRLGAPEFSTGDGNGLTIRLDNLEGNAYDASRLLLTLLNTQGNTTLRLHERFEVLNNIPVNYSDERLYPYIRTVSTNNQLGGALSNLSYTVETSQLTTGLAINVLASIAGDTINIRLGYSQASLVELREYAFGGADGIAGNLPVTDSSHRLFRMSIPNGSTRLIANATATSLGSSESASAFGLAGASANNSTNQRQTIIAVTAQIL